ncbi:MAG: hypothetical protein GF309_08660 [Candidatus Lokiarchaeota archaeon]|nr:hypothetical protein [Candidatus Lokiarchaeota archaeon]
MNERIEYMKSRNAKYLIGDSTIRESRISPVVDDRFSSTSTENGCSQDSELRVPLSYRIWSWLKTHLHPILLDE